MFLMQGLRKLVKERWNELKIIEESDTNEPRMDMDGVENGKGNRNLTSIRDPTTTS